MNDQPQPSKRTDIFLIVFAVMGLGVTVCGVGAMLMLSAIQGLTFGGTFEPFGLVTALTFLVVGLSGIPLAVISLKRLNDPASDKPGIPSKQWFVVLLLFPLVILVGHFTFRSQNFNAVLGTVAQLSAAAIPALVMVLIARRNGPPLSGRRVWGLYLGGAWLAPALSLVAEAILIIPFGLFILGQSNDLPQLQQLVDQVRQGSTTFVGEEQALDLVTQPVIWVPVVMFVSLLVPMIEEFLKSIAIWPLLARRLHPGEAFVGGVISGAGYAFVEALLLASPDPQWSLTMVARVGATMMHSFTTGIVAWGFARAWNESRPGHFLRAYGLAVLFHGLWNATTLAIVGFGIRSQTSASNAEGILLAGALMGLLFMIGLAIGAVTGIARLSKKYNPPLPASDQLVDQASG